ncbi:MAG: GGDEF domain-containing protein [Thiopseudomonas sp.]|nr:GGDEF domain-containing protein [Thiopseudomonas sp.]
MNALPTRASNLLAFPAPAQAVSAREALSEMRPSHSEVGQQLRNQLQTSLDVGELLQMFFNASQRLISYQGLSFRHACHRLEIVKGTVNGNYRIDYRLELEGEFLGMLCIHDEHPLEEHRLVSFECLTPALAFPLRNALKYVALLHASLHDPLTGARNRAGMAELLERDLKSAQRLGSPLSVLMIDVDHFKHVNDQHGHAGGDTVLIAIAQQLQENLRSVDAIFRFGGEEFLAVLPNTGLPYVLQVAERLRHAIEKMQVFHEGQRIRLSASFGVAVSQSKENQEMLLRRADTALYMAKQTGRNRVCLAD